MRTAAAARIAFVLAIFGGMVLAGPPPSEAQNPTPRASRPFLWKIEGAGKKPSWIFGTIHLQRPEVTNLPPQVRTAIDEADAVYTEIPADLPTMLALVPKMMLPKGQTIDRVLGPELTADLEKEIKSIQPEFTLDSLRQFKPWALAAALQLIEDQIKNPGMLALDVIIFQRAAIAGKETGGIETPDEQLAVFDGLTTAEQITMVKDTIRQLRSFRAEGKSASDFLTELYLAGDLDRLVGELNKLDAAGGDPELNAKLMDRLLYRRNAVMAERIVERLRKHPGTSYFFAVGAAHLQGGRGLIADLQKAGYRLTRTQSSSQR